MSEVDWCAGHEAKQERAHLRVWVSGVIVLLAVLGMVAWATKAYAQVPVHVLEQPGVSIRLMNAPCVDARSSAMIATNSPELLGRAKAISSTWKHKDGTDHEYAGCWVEMAAVSGRADAFLLVFSDGMATMVAKSEFRKMRGQVGA